MQYPNDELAYDSGIILDINNKKIKYSVCIENDASGAPLIKRYKNNLIIGIHYGSQKDEKSDKKYLYSLATPLDIIIKNIKYQLSKNNKNKINLIYERKDENNYDSLEDPNTNKQNNKEINNKYNNLNIKLKEPIHILNNHTKQVFCLSILKDGRLVSGSDDESIIIYNKETYQPDLTIKEHNNGITCITTLSSGILASCSRDETIKLFNIKDNKYEILQTLNYHKDEAYKIIEP